MAVDIFLYLTKIDGESKDSTHEKEIDILSWSWGMTQSGTTHMGGGGGSGKVSVNDISFVKYIDSASHALLLRCASGEHIEEGILVVRKAGKDPLEYLKITMTNIIVTSVQTGGSGGEDRLTESVSLNFEQVKYEYVEQKMDGTGEPAKPFTWNISANVPELK
ncbi:Hcp1 family type VI secretion system effector [Thalassotalea euphylliae]|uniref:Hcp1 family type VI secretion system effector n=1 Tax=Thalassotalea euphylliae TaxID=1655234 RepID=A0A3E0TUR9_9GAMM|nr:type VI secretion system tube protein Hcp [Thalassotalea euphylliae]REL27682.1 Hcp1 family type VI secretion system effector [Thalassotalea euphylliae]